MENVPFQERLPGFNIVACRLALSRQTGNDPPLVGLLRVFKNYYPEIIVGEATRGRASAFKVWLVCKILLPLLG